MLKYIMLSHFNNKKQVFENNLLQYIVIDKSGKVIDTVPTTADHQVLCGLAGAVADRSL